MSEAAGDTGNDASNSDPSDGGTAPNAKEPVRDRPVERVGGFWSGFRRLVGGVSAAIVGVAGAFIYINSAGPDTSRNPKVTPRIDGPEACLVDDEGNIADENCAKDAGIDLDSSAPPRTELDPAIYGGPRNSWTVSRSTSSALASPTDIGQSLSFSALQ